jgi:SnoaL-like domain
MSQENVESCRQNMEAWGRDDLDSWLATMDPIVEWHAAVERLVEGTENFYRGHEGMRRLWHFWRTEFEDFEIEAQELRDAGDDRVVLLGRIRWRGLASGSRRSRLSPWSSQFAAGRSSGRWTTSATRRPSKPLAFLNKTLTPTPEGAGYCAGDVAGERGDDPVA